MWQTNLSQPFCRSTGSVKLSPSCIITSHIVLFDVIKEYIWIFLCSQRNWQYHASQVKTCIASKASHTSFLSYAASCVILMMLGFCTAPQLMYSSELIWLATVQCNQGQLHMCPLTLWQFSLEVSWYVYAVHAETSLNLLPLDLIVDYLLCCTMWPTSTRYANHLSLHVIMNIPSPNKSTYLSSLNASLKNKISAVLFSLIDRMLDHLVRVFGLPWDHLDLFFLSQCSLLMSLRIDQILSPTCHFLFCLR